MVVVDGSSASTTYTASPTAARAAPTHTDQPRHRTNAPSRVGEQRGAHHGEHEAARVDDPSQRQRRHHTQRRQRERRHEAGAPDHHVRTGRRPRAVRDNVWFHAVANGVVDASTTTTDACGANAAGWVSTTTTPIPPSAPSARERVGRHPAEHRDHEVDAPVRARSCSNTDASWSRSSGPTVASMSTTS